MSKRFVLGLDAGGGGGSCLVLDTDTGAVTVATRPWRHPSVPGTDGWGLDFDYRSAWRLLAECVREAIAAAAAAPDDVAAIATTGMRHGMVVVDGAGREVVAVANRDARAAGQATALASEMGPELYVRTGHWPAPLLLAPRLQWLLDTEGAGFRGEGTVLPVSDWLTWRLCGVAVTERSQAGESLLLDLGADSWSGDLLAKLRIPAAILPGFRRSGDPCGELTPEAAEALGLAAGTTVVVGGADTQCGLLGGGALTAGSAGVVAGTTLPVQIVIGRPLVDEARRLWTGRHVVPDRWVLESNAGAAGLGLELLAKLMFGDDQRGTGRLLGEAAMAPVGAGGTTSTLGTDIFDAANLQLPIGSVALSTLAAGVAANPRGNIARAAVEGIAFAARANLEQAAALAGGLSGVLVSGGGLARDDWWNQLLADVTGREVARPQTYRVSVLGAAFCAAVGAGTASTLEEAATRWSGPGTAFEPRPEQARLYEELYGTWREIREARADADEAAAGLVLRMAAEGSELRPAMSRTDVRPTVLVTAPMNERSLGRLRETCEVRYAPFMESQVVLTEDDLVEAAGDVDVLVTEVDVVDGGSLARMPRLRAVFTCRGDPVNVDIAACTAHGIPVMSAPGRNARAVAEMTVAFLLTLRRRVLEADRFQHDEATGAGDIARMGMAHAEFETGELGAMTVGLVGLGQVGSEVARLLEPFGCRVIAHDPFARPEVAAAAGVDLVSLAELLSQADAVSLHAPVNEATRGMIGAEAFAHMKAGVLFVNTARAALVDEAALIGALKAGKVGGAALDVFSQEPPGADHPLLQFPNVIATPHVGGNTREVARRQGELVCEAMEDLLAGREPKTLLNRATMAAFSWSGPRRQPSREELARVAAGTGPAVTDLEVEEVTAAAVTPERGTPRGLRGLLRRGRKGGAPDMPPARKPAAAADAVPVAGVPRGDAAYWERLFADFLSGVAADEAVRRFANGKNVVVRYHVQDLNLVFHTGFTGDPPVTGMGEPAVAPHLTLRMTSAVLDDVFMERISGMKAAMGGKMAFSGNTMRAMTLQRVQKDLNRVYRTARERMGEPPAAIGRDEPVVSSAASSQRRPQQGEAAAPAAHAGPALVGDERDEMMALVNELYASHLLTSTGGNVSIRRPEHPDEAWITPSAIPKGHLSPEMLVRIGMDGESLDEGALSPSSEKLMHTAIYRARPEVQAVVHSHGPKGFALGLAGLPFLPVSTEAAFFGELARVPFTMPGTDELADAAVAAMGSGNGVLLVNHGLLVAASSLRRAVDMTAVIEETAGALLDCHAAGRTPPVLPDDVVAQLREIGEMMG
ncbi:MAG: NAD(P)-dependent oxidoreductase [Dehalococcoidia bacterium]|nr:class II aldolase/adducin family protein [Dehalococcoidia bacterium]MCB9485589.1 class II aldolase/adducin family protein [Thermoflexaceae bacterium]